MEQSDIDRCPWDVEADAIEFDADDFESAGAADLPEGQESTTLTPLSDENFGDSTCQSRRVHPQSQTITVRGGARALHALPIQPDRLVSPRSVIAKVTAPKIIPRPYQQPMRPASCRMLVLAVPRFVKIRFLS